MRDGLRLYRSRVLVSLDKPPVDNAAVLVENGIVRAAGAYEEVRRDFSGAEIVDLGEQVMLPGLINAHCHLDYTMMKGAIMPQKSFTQWILRINALKRHFTNADYLKAIGDGFQELQKWGTTSVLNIEAFPEVFTKLPPPPIRTWWCYELLDIREKLITPDLVDGAMWFFEPKKDWLGGIGLSPHSPYTASASLFKTVRTCADKFNMLVTTHLAESAEEFEMFMEAKGALYEFLLHLGRPTNDCGKITPLRYLVENGLIGPGIIFAHVNEIDDGDLKLLGKMASGIHVVHCPRSHRFLQHRPFRYEELSERKVNISLGTDSLASNDTLNLFSEMQTFHRNHPELAPESVLRMVTTNPARALRQENRLGMIKENFFADIIALPYENELGSVLEGIVENQEQVRWTMINGEVKESQV